MSNTINLSIETLPVELFHRIFDNLDTETIIFSVRPVSKLFQSIVNTYDRYNLNFILMSKLNMNVLCRLINPKNVISLTLSNDERTRDQVDLFNSFVSSEQFTRLHSLTLLNIRQNQLDIILEKLNGNVDKINFDLSEKFSIKIKKNYDTSTLRALDINMNMYKTLNISCLSNYTIQYLDIDSTIYLKELCGLLECCLHLHTLIIKDISQREIDNSFSRYFHQLKSLTIKRLSWMITDISKPFLLMIPSLVYLKLNGGINLMDGYQWEKFITMNLLQLDKFEFYFSGYDLTGDREKSLQSIISSFQTPFWIERKKWFVNGECAPNHPYIISLHCLPIRKSIVLGETDSPKISNIKNDLLLTNNITSLKILLNKLLADDIQKQKKTANDSLFNKVTEINLQFCGDWPLLSLQTLSTFIDISQIVRITISSSYDFKNYDQNTWLDIVSFINQASNLISLSFTRQLHIIYGTDSDETEEDRYSILPRRLKHLRISIDNTKEIKTILNRCENLSTIIFNSNMIARIHPELINLEEIVYTVQDCRVYFVHIAVPAAVVALVVIVVAVIVCVEILVGVVVLDEHVVGRVYLYAVQ